MNKKMVIAGGSGFMGTTLATYFLTQQYDVVVLTRGKARRSNGIDFVHWDAKTQADWVKTLDHVDVLINLTGKSVDCKYTKENKDLILNSRVDATRMLGEVLSNMDNPPPVWLNASTATIYEDTQTHRNTEANGRIGNDFSMSVAKRWEKSFFQANTPKTRKVALRTSLVIGRNGGVLPVLGKLVQYGLGGHQGTGNQKFAWIHEADMIRIVAFCIERNYFSGVVNCVTTSDINNRQFMKAFRKAKRVSFGLSSPVWAIKFGAFFMGTESELILKSRYVYPEKLLKAGFEFVYTDINIALKQLLE